VKRIKVGSKDTDTFTYNVLMDVYIMQNKDWMKKKYKTNQDVYD